MDAGGENNEGDSNGGEAFDFGAVLGEFLATGKFFPTDNEEARNGVDEGVGGIRSNRKGVSKKADDEIYGGEQKIRGNKKTSGFNDNLATRFFHIYYISILLEKIGEIWYIIYVAGIV